MSAQRALYRRVLQLTRHMSREGLPCTGCVGLHSIFGILCPEKYVANAFRTNSSEHMNDAFHAMRMLPRQAAVLQASEEDTREALQQWQQLQQCWCSKGPLSLQQELEAAESAGWLLQRLATRQKAQEMLIEEDAEDLQQQAEERIASAQQQLDAWAQEVRAAAPEAFGKGASKEQRLQQLTNLHQVLCVQRKLRCDPFEWVYEGLDPLMLPAVIYKRKGIPISLAIVAGGVARRLGMDMQLVCADDSQIPGTASGPLIMQHMPPEIAARQAGRSLAGAPPPASWLLQLVPAAGQQWGESDLVFLDFSRKGRLLSTSACIQQYPAMESILQQQQTQARQLHSSCSISSNTGVVQVWADMARTMVMAHQRQGLSDLVAHWLYQLLALDTNAEEWNHVLQQ